MGIIKQKKTRKQNKNRNEPSKLYSN